MWSQPPPPTKVTIVGENENCNWEDLVKPFLVHKLLGPKPPPLPPLKRRPAHASQHRASTFCMGLILEGAMAPWPAMCPTFWEGGLGRSCALNFWGVAGPLQ